MTPKTFRVVVFVVVIALILLFVLYVIYKQQHAVASTQEKLGDRDLLRKIADQPDGFLTSHLLSEISALSLGEARVRLSTLNSAGLIDSGYNSSGRSYYRLCAPIIESPPLDLSSEPFLTVEDILQLFRAYEFKLTEQDLIIATGLPLALIRRELKHFEQEKVLETVYTSNPMGTANQRMYVLKEPYRSQPEVFLQQADTLDLELRTILRNDNFIV